MKTTARKLKWRTSRPSLSAFAGVTGDATEYRVRMLDVTAADDASVRAAVAQVFAMVLRLAGRSLTRERRFVLFVWDPVYSRLTVTFTDPKRRDEAPDVLKLSCVGWDVALQNLDGRKRSMKENALSSRMYDWIEAAMKEDDEGVARIRRELGFKVTFAFSEDVEGSSYQRIE